MITKKTALAVLARLFIFAISPHTACAAAQPANDSAKNIASRIDHYFSEPRSPETFRALSGMGLPAGATIPDSYPAARLWNAGAEDKELLQRLFPYLAASAQSQYWYPDFGGCRVEAPLQQFKDRLARLGADHPYIAQWLLAERAVLAICMLKPKNVTVAPVLPPALEAADPVIALLQIQDRAYQHAAMLFYRGDRGGALAEFAAIALDQASPNRPLAAYLVLAIHAGSGAETRSDRQPGVNSLVQSPEESLKAIQAVLADPSLQSIHAMAAGLIGWMAANGDDASAATAQLHEAFSALTTPTDRIDHCSQCLMRYEAALSDLGYLQRNIFYSRANSPDWVLTGQLPQDFRTSAALAALAKTEPMAAWVAFPTDAYRVHAWALAAKMPQPDAVRSYLDRKSNSGASADCPWLHENPATDAAILLRLVDDELARLKTGTDVDEHAAALSFDYYNLIRHLLMDTDDGRDHFKTALRQLVNFPYKDTITYGRTVDDSLQYLITVGRLTDARRLRDALKLDRPEGRLAYTNSAGALMVLAEDEDHLLRVLATAPFYPREYLNHLPTAELWRLAAKRELSRGQRALFVRAAWSRDFAMGRVIGREHDKLLRALAPEITDTWQTPPGRDVKPDDISVVRDVLKSPGLNTVIEDFSRMPDDTSGQATSALTGLDQYNHNDNNWWCTFNIHRHETALDDTLAQGFRLDDDKPEQAHKRVRTMLQHALADSYLFDRINPAELKKLAKVDCAPQVLSERVVAWVRSSRAGTDKASAQAEALADAVRSTRWGCNRDGSHAAYSREAFELLHARFPDSPEAKRTPYWFN
jgi:hypothetical protein